MRYPWANFTILILILVQIVSGYFGFNNGYQTRAWLLWVHGIGAYTLVIALFWKGAIILNAYSRNQRWGWGRIAFLTMAVLLLLVLLTGLVWTYYGPHYIAGFSLVTVHIFLAISLSAILIWHIIRFRWILKVPQSRDRRAFLSNISLGLAGAILWRSTSYLKGILEIEGAKRRFTGSYETGSYSVTFPVVSWLSDKPPAIVVPEWNLSIEGEVRRKLVFTYQQLLQLESVTINSTLDCTGGWYCKQRWKGVSVKLLLEMAIPGSQTKSVIFESITGYSRRFSVSDAFNYILATHVADQQLSQGHGYPLRLVAPNQRGVQWVKWVSKVKLVNTPPYMQSPLPLQ